MKPPELKIYSVIVSIPIQMRAVNPEHALHEAVNAMLRVAGWYKSARLITDIETWTYSEPVLDSPDRGA